MKILFVTPYPPITGGVSVFAKNTVDSLIKNGITVEVCMFKGIHTFKNLATKIKSFSPDAIRIEYNFATYGGFTIPLFFFLYTLKIKYKYTIFTNFHEASREAKMLGFIGIYINRFVTTLSDKISVHTLEAKASLVGKCGISENKIKIVPLGTLNVNDSATNINTLKTKFGITTERYILFIGFIHVHKGIEYLIKAFAQFKQKSNESIQLVIGGGVRKRKGLFKYFEKKDIKYLNMLKAITEEKGLTHNVVFTGYISDNDFSGLIKNAAVVVIPYTNTEQSGILNHVLPYNVPIIASNIGGLKETLETIGILVEPRDENSIYSALVKVIQNDKFKNELVNNYHNLNIQLNSTLIAKIIAEYIGENIKSYNYS